MSKKRNGVNYSKRVPVQSRRSRVLDRLILQLKLGSKTTREGTALLSEKDVKRIEKEINNLKQKL